MKFKTLTKGIFICILAGTFIFGGNALALDAKSKYLEKAHETKKGKKFSKINLNFLPGPKTGQNLEILVKTWSGGDYHTTKGIKIYEDGVELKGPDGTFTDLIRREVIHTKPGKHAYFAEALYENGETRRSETKHAEFTGELLDAPPYIAVVGVHQGRELLLRATDYGDNKGIVRYEVYEDGELWIEEDCEPEAYLFRKIPLDLRKSGKHKYQVIFTDRGGNTLEETAILDYSGSYVKEIL